MKIIDSVVANILAVWELHEDHKLRDDETVVCACYALYYSCTNLCQEFGITRVQVCDEMIRMGYDKEMAILIVDHYDNWARRITVKAGDKPSYHC